MWQRVAGLLALAFIVSGCAAPQVKGPADEWEFPGGPYLLLNLESKGGSGILVPTAARQDTAGDGDSIAVTGATGAASNGVSYLRDGTVAQGFPFSLEETLAEEVHLDVARAVRGNIFVSTTAGDAGAPRNVDNARIRIELWVGGEFAGGTEYDYALLASAQGTAWRPVPVHFRPEVRSIPADQPVEVRVAAMAGFTDLVVGTGLQHQSYIALRTLETDPLAGDVFVQYGQLLQGPSAAPPEQPSAAGEGPRPVEPAAAPGPATPAVAPGSARDEADTPLVVLAAAALVGLLGLVVRRPPGRGATCLVLAAIVLAGCAGPPQYLEPEQPEPVTDAPPSPEPAPSNETAEPAAQEAPAGAVVNGTVVDDQGSPVPNATIVLRNTLPAGNASTGNASTGNASTGNASTDAEQPSVWHNATTNGTGAFRFTDVPPGPYNLTAVAPGFAAYAAPINVTHADLAVAVRLTPEASPGGERADGWHQHDAWDGEVRRLVDEVTFSPGLDGAPFLVDAGRDAASACVVQEGDSGSNQSGYHDGRVCDYLVPLGDDAMVLPGTITLEVTLTWDTSGTTAPKRLGLQYENAVQTSGPANRYVPRPPGQPFHVQVFPNEADPAHAEETWWRFFVEVPGDDVQSNWQSPVRHMPDVSVTIHAHKGVVPYEPVHG